MEYTRIRYTKPVDGVCNSRQVYKITGKKEVSVRLDYNTFQFNLIDSSTGISLYNGGNTKNKAVLKIQAKNTLEALGVRFKEEERPSRRGPRKEMVAQLENQNK